MAKEQGYRSRAAFKLVQINRKFSLLEKCHSSVLDLCAAPGGWTQVCYQTCPKSCHIVAVDILPIRAFPRHQQQNVTTLIGDITTDACQAEIRRTIKGLGGATNHNGKAAAGVGLVDLVLHDGAPNIGAEYGKDAFEQNELSLHALKCACHHLKLGGSFVTKLYRSRDYAKYLFVLQQLFGQVQAFKPKASRLQSAEIFLVATHYKAPSQLDPRFLDPKHVFASVEGDTTGGDAGPGTANPLSIFHKQFGQQKRHRQGYDMDFYDGITLRRVESVAAYCQAPFKEAVAMLSRCSSLTFGCDICRPTNESSSSKGCAANDSFSCHCALYRHHPLTSTEIIECLGDLKVLNKADFKGLLAWRAKMQDALEAAQDGPNDDDDNDDDDDQSSSGASDDDDDDDDDEEEDSEKEEAEIQAEIAELQKKRQQERKRLRKKERAAAAKRRKVAALNGGTNSTETLLPEHDKIFSLATITSQGDLDAAAEVNLDRISDDMLLPDDDDDIVVGGEDDEARTALSSEERWKLRERELDEAYDMYLQTTQNGLATSGTKMAKRSKKLQRLKVAQEAAEDQEMTLATPAGIDHDTKAYVQLLQGPKDSDDDTDGDERNDSSDSEDDGFFSEAMLPEEHAVVHESRKSRKSQGNPLIRKFDDEPASAKTARWFSNPLFASIGAAAQSVTVKANQSKVEDEVDAAEDDKDDTGLSKVTKGMDADDVLASIPKTDKQKRHEKRLKLMARDEWKKARRARKLGEEEEQFEIAAADEEAADDEQKHDLQHLSESRRNQILQARDLIKAGMGTLANDDDKPSSGTIEVVGQGNTGHLAVADTRKYDSDNEAYDSDDYAQTLALGTMMLRRSKEKAFVDASYNRYAWNDPEGLPEWFVDDENRHYRPQLPIPPALLAKMKEKMMALSTKPIAKVAEARARKSKRAKAKLAAAKKQAEAVANNPDMTEAMKLKAISKALRGQETRKPSKTYVVAKKGRSSKHSKKGVKMVDKRMKSDKRAMDRKEKRKGKRRA